MTLVGHRARNHPQQIEARGPLDDVDDRRTPPDLLAECLDLTGFSQFDLDVAASSENRKAPYYYDVAADGLERPWWGHVWCNPPFSDIASWVVKAHAERRRCNGIAMLLPANRTEQAWWQAFIEPHRLNGDVRVHFLGKRRRFDRPGWEKPAKGDRPPFGLCLVVWP